MKKLMAALFITLSLTSALQANEVINLSGGITVSPFLTTMMAGGFPCKEALDILNDSEEYARSGKLSILLNQKVLDVQANVDVSTEEALDLLIEAAQKSLTTK